MCRFAFYLGPEIPISALVTEPVHSIIHQSYKSEEREEPLNGDGFGIGWYPEIHDEDAAIFKDVSPAWSNPNLQHLARAIRSRCILAHVRAASPGLAVTQINCHPFAWREFAFMHNGRIEDFEHIERELRHRLSDGVYHWIRGTTDSEHLFARFADHYMRLEQEAGDDDEEPSVERSARALIATIAEIESLCAEAGRGGEIDLNLVVANGRSAVISRYSSAGRQPNTLYVHTGYRYDCEDGEPVLEPSERPAVLVASEPLTRDDSWRCIDPNCLLLVGEDLRVEERPIATGG